MRSDTSGFTMVEVIVALVILAVGILGLAGTTALVVRQVNTSKIATERGAALQSAIEEIRAYGFEDVPTTGSDSFGRYTVDWTAVSVGRTKIVEVVMTGPGLQSYSGNLSSLSGSVTDTFTYKLIRP